MDCGRAEVAGCKQCGEHVYSKYIGSGAGRKGLNANQRMTFAVSARNLLKGLPGELKANLHICYKTRTKKALDFLVKFDNLPRPWGGNGIMK